MRTFFIYVEDRLLRFKHGQDEYTCDISSSENVEESINVGKLQYFEAVYGKHLADIVTLPPSERKKEIKNYLEHRTYFDAALEVVW